MVLSAIGRMLWVPIAFLIAMAASIVVLVSLGLERVTQAVYSRASETDTLAIMFEMLRQAHLLSTGLTLVPAIAAVIIGEVARIRSALYYILAGGAALAAVPLIARLGQSVSTPNGAVPDALVWQVFATAGFVGGLVYWLLAGRSA
jgi:hypothetical protein